MKNIVTYTADTLNAATTVNIPGDFQIYMRGISYAEVEVTIELTGDTVGQVDLTAKRISSSDDLTPVENSTFLASEMPQSVTYFGSFDSITVTPDAAFIADDNRYKLIINIGETY